MNANKKVIKAIIIITIFTISFFTSIVFAENTITNTQTTTNANTLSEESINKNTTTNEELSTNATVNKSNTVTNNGQSQTVTKSNNANLSNLGITPNDFSGFKESKTEYNVTVPNTITEVEVYATKKDSKSNLTGTGMVKLQEGDNIAKVIVTAEDGTTKTYTINIKRLKIGEKETTNNNNSQIQLEKLEITGATLEPSFSQNTYQYKVNIEGSQKNLDIIAEADGANVKILGNENLINGQNIITILVTDEKETSSATYQIYVNKNLIEQEELNKQLEEAENQYQTKQWIIRILIITIVICIIILLILIYKKTNSKEYIEEQNKKRLIKYSHKNEIKTKNENNKKRKSGKHSKK